MKKLVPLFAALALIGLYACDSFKAGVYQDEMIMPLEGSQEDSLFYKVSIQYAKSGMLIPAMEKMNAAIVGAAFDMEGVDIGPLEETAIQYRENLIDEYITENSSMVGELPVLTWEDILNGEFTSKYKGWRNYLISYYWYRGGAHGSTTCVQIVFDAKTGEVVTEADLFTDYYEEKVGALIQEQIRADISRDNPDAMEIFDVDEAAPNGNFSVGPDGVQWIFQPDDLLPYAFGPLAVTVSWDKLRPYMR